MTFPRTPLALAAVGLLAVLLGGCAMLDYECVRGEWKTRPVLLCPPGRGSCFRIGPSEESEGCITYTTEAGVRGKTCGAYSLTYGEVFSCYEYRKKP